MVDFRRATALTRTLIIGAWLVVPWAAWAAYPDATTTVGSATIHDCYDGDTCTISIPTLPGIFGDRLGLRLVGIDTPEMKGHCDRERDLAREAKAFLLKHLREAQDIQIEFVARDKYFRVLALIVADGLDLADELVKAGLAYAYSGGTKSSWCNTNTQ